MALVVAPDRLQAGIEMPVVLSLAGASGEHQYVKVTVMVSW
ncbi:hypothetical protein ABE493_14460 [Stenotrophomonas terrae]